ncbi:MAG: heparinase II/III family protein [Nitriliruptorales bacterium]|nr:heparinase II/III family protein [Nitriliruptorales bacterium]
MSTSFLRRFLKRLLARDRVEAARGLLPGPLSRPPEEAAQALMAGTLHIPGFDTKKAPGGKIDWSGSDEPPRAYLRQLHGHAMLRDFAHAHRRTGQRDLLDFAVGIVRDWLQRNPREQPANRMAWHDEATAMRVQSWLLLREELLAVGHGAAKQITHALNDHAALLASEEFHTTGTNHGMFQDESLLTYASLVPEDPLSSSYFELATSRLDAYFDLIVTSDGVHREHAPSYHNLIAGKIKRMATFYEEAGEDETAQQLQTLQRSMSRYATHVIKPDASFPLVSDTFERVRPKPDLFDDDEYLWAASRGQDGVPPRERQVVFPDGGYAIFRNRWSADGNATYIHFTAAYHTDYHKHSDDLSVWLYHNGDLLTEAGPNGYDYDNPFTAYGYSAHAHNTLLVDGESLPRVDDQSDEVHLVAWDVDGPEPWATGRNARFDDLVHERTVRFDPEALHLEVHDLIEGVSAHRYTLLWNCAPGVEPHISEGTVILQRDGEKAATITLESPEPVKLNRVYGDIDARRGFRLGGGDPTPTWVVEIEVESVDELSLTHTIALQ